MTEEEAMIAHKDTWSSRQLLQKILSRHCHVLEDVGGRTPTYLVAEKKDEDMHEALLEINQHLSKLGYSARLYPDDPWIVQLLPDPTRQWPSPRFVASMWVISLLTTLLAGEMWMEGARPKDGWFVENVTLDAFIGYTLPLFGTLIIASFIQIKIAAQRGVKLPHLFPIPGPAMIWWPFGILGFASLPRSDARLWPDRSSLGNSALSAPFTMIFIGMGLILGGIYLTPELVPLTSTPLIVELPLLIQLIGLSIETETAMLLKTSWAHPFTRAGMTLTFLGWVSLLPIPTFPGGRILIARMGLPEARSGSSQVMLLIVVLLFAFLFGAFAGWSIWVPVVALCASLLITKGSDPRLPIVLDDFKGLPDVDHRRLGVILFLTFMLALPAQVPFYEDESWDDKLEWEIEDEDLEIKEGWFNQTIIVSNPSLVTQEWKISYVGGLFGDSNLSEIICKNGEISAQHTCSGEIAPLEKLKLEFHFQWLEEWNTTSVNQLWLIGNDLTESTVSPDQSTYPVGFWRFNGDLDDPISCIDIGGKYRETLNLSDLPEFANWDNLNDEGNVSLTKGNPEICVESLSGDDMSWLSETIFKVDNVTYKTGYSSQNTIAIPDEGVILNDSELIFSQSILALNHKGDCLDLGNPSPPLSSNNETKIWNMSILPVAMNNLENSNDSILLLVPRDSTIHDCENPYTPTRYNIENGPSLIVGEGENKTQKWIGSINVENDIIVVENPGSTEVNVRIEFDGNGPQWNVSNNIVLPAGQITTISAEAPDSGLSYAWFEFDDGEVILHLVNHEV